MQRLRELTEAECYLRCYGWVGEEGDVCIVERPSRRPATSRDRPIPDSRRADEEGLGLPDQEAA